MSSPLVSIIMPAYNAEKYIANSIQSIVNQTYDNLELLIVDDCSTDSTKHIMENFAKRDIRIKPIFRTKNSSKPAIAKNSAFEFLKGDYVAFLDSDDLWLDNKLEEQMSLMQSSDFALCYTGGYYIDECGNSIGSFLPRYSCGHIINKLLFRYEINNQSVVVKREVLTEFNKDITIGEDYNLFMNIAVNDRACSIKKKLIKYRIHDKSITNKKLYDLSEGTLFTLKELNIKYNLFFKYPIEYSICFTNAIRHKIKSKLYSLWV